MGRVLYRATAAAAIGSAIACGPEADELEVDCDAPSVPLLMVDGDELATPAGRVGDARLFEVTTFDDDLADLLASGYGVSWDSEAERRIVAVESCGDEPRLVGHGLGDVQVPPREDLPWLAGGSDASPGLWWIDPVHGRAPEHLSSNKFSRSWFAGGVLVVDDDQLVRIDAPQVGESTRTMLVDDIQALALAASHALVVERVAAVTNDEELVRVDMEGGVERVRSGVGAAWAFDPHARAMVAVTFDTRNVALDVDAGVEIALGDGGGLTGTGSAVWSRLEDSESDQTQLVLMPEVRELRLPGRWDCHACRLGAPVRALRGPEGIHLLASDSDVPDLVFPGEADVVVGDEAIYIVEYEVDAETPGYPLGAPYRVLQMELDGTGLVPLFDRTVASAARLTDGRWATIDTASDGGLGPLSIWNDEQELDVDADVLAVLEQWNDADLTFARPRADFLYSTVSSGHGHNIVWLADADRLLP